MDYFYIIDTGKHRREWIIWGSNNATAADVLACVYKIAKNMGGSPFDVELFRLATEADHERCE